MAGVVAENIATCWKEDTCFSSSASAGKDCPLVAGLSRQGSPLAPDDARVSQGVKIPKFGRHWKDGRY